MTGEDVGEGRGGTPASVADPDRVATPGQRASPQPGQRSPAPGALATVQAFINTHFDLVDRWGADLFATPAGLREWCVQRGLIDAQVRALERADVHRAIAVREGLRALAAAASARDGELPADRMDALNAAAAGLSLELRFETREAAREQRLATAGATLVPAVEEPLARALATVLAIAYRAMVDGSWERLKICPGEHCGWAFYDHSRNKSGRWCSMSVCGGRAKARSHYRRARGADSQGEPPSDLPGARELA